MIIIKDFYADWCKPCKALDKVLKEINDEYEDVVLKKFDVEDPENEELVTNLKIRSVPTVIIEKDGIILEKSVGMQNKTFFTNILNLHNEKENSN